MCLHAAGPVAGSVCRPEPADVDKVAASPSCALERLRKRPDFLFVAKGVKWVAPAFVLQARWRLDLESSAPRVGFTASRKVGGAVGRNLARRRLKEATRLTFPGKARCGTDYVLVARKATGGFDFQSILQDLDHALHMVHKRLDSRRQPERRAGTENSSGARPAQRKQQSQ